MTVPPQPPVPPGNGPFPGQPGNSAFPGQPGNSAFPRQPGAGPGPGPLKVRYNPGFGAIALVIGVLNLILAIVNDYPIGWFTGIVFTVLGVLYCVGTALEVDQQTARVKSPMQITMKTVPLHGIGDLVLEGKMLYRAGDHLKIVNLGWGSTRGDDIERLQAAIAQARHPLSPPPAQW